MSGPEILRGETTHARRGGPVHAFRYAVDYVLIDPEADGPRPRLFGRNRFALAAVHDRDHGGARGQGRGAAWAREVLAASGAPVGLSLRLLTQPRWLGANFTPVSFWLAFEGDALVAAIAQVNNTYGERHNYLCAHADFGAITASDELSAAKVFHVSPFQQVAGVYRFRFVIDADRIAIRIRHENGAQGVVATLTGARVPMTSRTLLATVLRRPFSTFRTIALIHWQALRLKLKGATFHPHPVPPVEETSR